MFKSQRKLEEQRALKSLEESKEITGHPKLNPNSEQICQKIQEEYFRQLATSCEEGSGVEHSKNASAGNRDGQSSKESNAIGDLNLGSINQQPYQEHSGSELVVAQEFLAGAHGNINNYSDQQRDNQEQLSAIIESNNSMPHTVNTNSITLALPTKRKKSPKNVLVAKTKAVRSLLNSTQKSPAVKQLAAQKKALAKAVPQMPTFAPKINKRSQKLVNQIQQREALRQRVRWETEPHQSQLERRETITNAADSRIQQKRSIESDLLGSQVTTKMRFNESPIFREDHHYVEQARMQTEPDLEVSNTELDGSKSYRERRIKSPLVTSDRPMKTEESHDRNDLSNFKIPSSHDGESLRARTDLGFQRALSPSNPQVNERLLRHRAREEPRIAELKAEQQRIQKERQKKQAEAQSRKHNENLVLRNFKKEFDDIMVQLGLGMTQTREQLDDVQRVAANKPAENNQNLKDTSESNLLQLTSTMKSDRTTSTNQYFSAHSHEGIDETVQVDLAIVLFHLGFLKSLNPHKDSQRTLLDQYICTLDDNQQKQAFKTNLFNVLAAIQSINLKDHYTLYSTFGLLQHHILEEITLQVDLGTSNLSISNQSNANNSKTISAKQMSNWNKDATADLSPNGASSLGLLVEALMQLAMQPFPFSINHSHLVKMHLTFMSFFLNRKDTISQGHRMSLEQAEFQKYKYQPEIVDTQTSFSPSRNRTPLNEPNRYYDELKRNIKERAAKLSSLRAEKERETMDACTFRPQVNPKSTKIAYKQVVEMHIGQKEFSKMYTTEATEEEESIGLAKDQRIAQFLEGDTSDEKMATVSANTSQISQNRGRAKLTVNKGQPGLSRLKKQSSPQSQSRIEKRIDKLVKDYVVDKRTGKKMDISTEQKEFESSQNELSFRPNIAKSQISHQLTSRKSPQSRNVNLMSKTLKKSPTTGTQSPLAKANAATNSSMNNNSQQQLVKKKALMFNSNKTTLKSSSPTLNFYKPHQNNTYMGRLQTQLLRRKKSPPRKEWSKQESSAKPDTSMQDRSRKSSTNKKATQNSSKLSINQKKPQIIVDPETPIQLVRQKSLESKKKQNQTLEQVNAFDSTPVNQMIDASFPTTADIKREKTNSAAVVLTHSRKRSQEESNYDSTHENFMQPKVSEYYSQDRRREQLLQEQKVQLLNIEGLNDEESTAEFIKSNSPKLGAPPSVADILCYNNSRVQNDSMNAQSLMTSEEAISSAQIHKHGQRVEMAIEECREENAMNARYDEDGESESLEWSAGVRDSDKFQKGQLQKSQEYFGQQPSTREMENFEAAMETNGRNRESEMMDDRINGMQKEKSPRRGTEQVLVTQPPLESEQLQSHFNSQENRNIVKVATQEAHWLKNENMPQVASFSGYNEMSSEFPRNLLMSTNMSQVTTSHHAAPGHDQQPNYMANSQHEWTSEFARAVDDVITVDQTVASQACSRFSNQGALINRVTQSHLSSQKFLHATANKESFESNPQIITPNRFTQFSEAPRQEPSNIAQFTTGQHSTQREVFSELRIAERLDEDDGAYEEVHDGRMCEPHEPSSSSIKKISSGQSKAHQTQNQSSREEESSLQMAQVDGSQLMDNQPLRQRGADQMAYRQEEDTSQASSVNKGQPYRYVNDGSSSSPQENHEKRHNFVDSTIQIGMIGQNIEQEEDRMMNQEPNLGRLSLQNRNDDMPRIATSSKLQYSANSPVGRSSDMFFYKNQMHSQRLYEESDVNQKQSNNQINISAEIYDEFVHQPERQVAQLKAESCGQFADPDQSSTQEVIISVPDRSSDMTGGNGAAMSSPQSRKDLQELNFNNALEDQETEVRVSNLDDFQTINLSANGRTITPKGQSPISRKDQVSSKSKKAHKFQRAETEDVIMSKWGVLQDSGPLNPAVKSKSRSSQGQVSASGQSAARSQKMQHMQHINAEREVEPIGEMGVQEIIAHTDAYNHESYDKEVNRDRLSMTTRMLLEEAQLQRQSEVAGTHGSKAHDQMQYNNYHY